MKKCRVLVLVLLITFVFSGCSFHLSSSLDELIAPVSPFGEDAAIAKALDDYAGKYTLKTCVYGEYTSSFVKADLNGDGSAEAFAFYEPSSALGTVYLAVMVPNDDDDTWRVTFSAPGEGSDVGEIDFADMTGDGRQEILVNWEVISNTSNNILSVYSYTDENGGVELQAVGEPLSFSKYTSADLNHDGLNELLLFNLPGSDTESASAVVYSMENGRVRRLGQTKLDSNVTAYSSVTVDSSDPDNPVVYADAYKNNGSAMITEIVYWSDYYDTIISPFYDYDTGLTRETFRENTVQCRDIDGDGKVEIPMEPQKQSASAGQQLTLIDWQVYRDYVLFHKTYGVLNRKDGYFLNLDDALFENAVFAYDGETRELTVRDAASDRVVCTLKTVFKADYSAQAYSGYTQFYEKAPFCYLVAVNENDYGITADTVADHFIEY